ncbi:MAG TPA: hypothetical protein VM097_09080 [Mycobacteriales bacterium]|nr:hypothetical protein [Mycobacteriales bacterium]
MPDALLDKELATLVQRLRLWAPARWAAACPPWGTRADAARHLAQWCADRAAELEGAPLRALPRLAPDLLVADQLAVTGTDLLRAEPPPALVSDAVAHLLVHRYDLLGEEPPATLGGAQALVRGREVCGA